MNGNGMQTPDDVRHRLLRNAHARSVKRQANRAAFWSARMRRVRAGIPVPRKAKAALEQVARSKPDNTGKV